MLFAYLIVLLYEDDCCNFGNVNLNFEIHFPISKVSFRYHHCLNIMAIMVNNTDSEGLEMKTLKNSFFSGSNHLSFIIRICRLIGKLPFLCSYCIFRLLGNVKARQSFFIFVLFVSLEVPNCSLLTHYH